ncbi:MAG: 3-deoxy-D-manno-octulosonic acid transferase [Planctomycetia bacterium]|nr:3-deoxy-D-manno-octulosonic acid transferase [Planctomycetia bacterium]
MPYLLNLLYAVLLILCSPWLLAGAFRKGKYRDGLGAKLLGLVPLRDSTATCTWVHAVSMGEVSLIAPLVEELKGRHPNWEIVISTTTVTGYALAKSRYSQHAVFYCPLDFSWAVRRAVARIRPQILILAELELWPNLIAAARMAGAKVAVVNGRLSDRSFHGYRRFRPLVRRLLGQIDLIAAQNPLYADRFLEIGAQNDAVYVTGSLKFDGAQTDRDNPATTRLRSLAGFQSRDTIFLAGSTQHPEEQLALAAFRQLAPAHPELRLVIVPRHPDRFGEVAEILAASNLAWQRRSGLQIDGPNPRARVLLVDQVGELGAWWGTAGIAYVGGSMGKRNGQNMIEPAAYGAAVAFGPMTRNFRDVVAALLNAGAGVVVHDGAELAAFVRRCLDEPAFAADLGNRARRVVASQLGATRRTADLLDALVANASNSQSRRAA